MMDPLYIGPIDTLCRYLAGEPITHHDVTTDESPWTVVPVHRQQAAWLPPLLPLEVHHT